ncbi:hypothetical protein IFM47457_04898 [Aspergillus lentulus]|nr:hypothetical protein IFM47457_04898 [Aspergillus lentulus]
MPSYIYQPELSHGLPTTSQVRGFHTLPDAHANELESMVQELSHGLPTMDTDTVMKEGIIDRMLIDDDPGRELLYELVETQIDEQGCFVLVANVIVGEPNGWEEFDVEIEDWGAEEHLAGDVQEGVSEPWNRPLDDLLLDWCDIGETLLLCVLRRLTPQTMISLRCIQGRADRGRELSHN